jgi:hypothetical protein
MEIKSIKLEELNRKTLVKLIRNYDEYIQEICEDEQNIINRYPVGVGEFINNEFIENIDSKSYAVPAKIMSESIMEIIEDALDNRDITIPDDEREDCNPRICGGIYTEIDNRIIEIIKNYI